MNSKYYGILLILALCLFCCKNSRSNERVDSKILETKWQKNNEGMKFGHRYIVTGKFCTSGKMIELFEHYRNGKSGNELQKIYPVSNSDSTRNECNGGVVAILESNDKSCPSFVIHGNCQLVGFSYIKNEGDLNGDGLDELSYVSDYDDVSSLNSYIIVSIKKNEWIELLQFPINESILPNFDTDTTRVVYTESEDEYSNTHNEELSEINNKKLVHKIKNQVVEITYYDDGDWKNCKRKLP